jgi:hypothetical protein
MSFGLIYEHWRQDINECFYIGKAMGKNPYARAYDLTARNKDHGNIVSELEIKNLIEVRTSEFPGITKSALNNLEILAIAHWKMYIGKRLTNKTKGGDGGDTWSQLTPEAKAKAISNGVSKRNVLGLGPKISAGWHAKPQHEKDDAHARKAANTDYAARNVKRKITLEAKSQEEKDASTAKRLAKSDFKKSGEKVRASWDALPLEEKIERGKKTSAGHAKRSKAEKQATENRRQETLRLKNAERKENGELTSSEKRAKTIREQDEKRKASNEMTRGEKISDTQRKNAEKRRIKEEARRAAGELTSYEKAWETRRRKKAEALAKQETE